MLFLRSLSLSLFGGRGVGGRRLSKKTWSVEESRERREGEEDRKKDWRGGGGRAQGREIVRPAVLVQGEGKEQQ